MNDLESILKKRRSVRTFRDGRIERSTLERLVELALWAPSSCNRQTVQFRFVDDPELIARAAKGAFDQPILHQPITLAVVCIDLGRYRTVTLENNLAPYLDAGLAMQNFLLAASESGIGSCVIAGRLDQELIRNALDIPESWAVTALIALGYSDEHNPPPERDPAGEHISYDTQRSALATSPYERHTALRKRWARAGFNVTWAYRRPIEGLPLFTHALETARNLIRPGEHCLVTNTLMGELLVESEQVDHLAASGDELWYLETFLSSRARIIRTDLLGIETLVPNDTYDRIISPFDVHFLGDEELNRFGENASRWLKPGGTLTLLFINGRSPWGLNHMLAELFRRDLSGSRHFGYERPLSPRLVERRLKGWFRPSSHVTLSFFPPPNFGYLLPRIRLVPLGLVQPLDVLGRVPLIGKLGNIAQLDMVSRR
jgi:nitroreductase/SAM-dependent methyltransferase